MNLKVLPKTALPDWMDRLRAGYHLIGPKRSQTDWIFGEINSAAEVDFTYSTTILPPKKVLAPQREVLLTFGGNGNQVEACLENQPTVVLGVHTCDMHALALLDRVFSQGFADQHYLSRRENTTLVSIECLQPCLDGSFCKDMGTLVVPEDFDLHLTDIGEEYVVDVGSEKGEALIRGLPEVRPAEQKETRRLAKMLGEKWSRFPYRLGVDVTELPGLLSISYRSTLWDDLGEQCLGCGACTVVCPTCFCFNVADEVDFSLNSGKRLRVWDSCQLEHFALVAGGHDFRAGHSSRLRHRFAHKYKYLTEAYNLAGCVGCGRCAQYCLVDITPVDVLNKLDKRRVSFTRRRQEEVSV